MVNVKPWIKAARPRTLPLSLACIGMGSFLAASQDQFDTSIFLFSVLTTIFLQVLSNLSNDYGDSVHGADSIHREGPSRTVQSGEISAEKMRSAIRFVAILSFLSGTFLIWVAFSWDFQALLAFLVLGVLAIVAAITYTSGKRPYGYVGLGDLSVLLFFGLAGVLGTYFLYTKTLEWPILLPALSCGLFSVAVLNLNNIRDIESDKLAGKLSIPVRIGRSNAVIYHWSLLIAAIAAALIFVLKDFQGYLQLVFLVSVPLIIINAKAAKSKIEPAELDPYLKQLALTTLLFVVAFGLGLLLS